MYYNILYQIKINQGVFTDQTNVVNVKLMAIMKDIKKEAFI